MIAEPVSLRLELESHPENVACVRSALTGLSEALELGPQLTSDLKTALSEACNNVVLHAYAGASGPMIVEIAGNRDGIHVAVIDRGHGIVSVSGGEDRMGLGLAVISALASSTEFSHPDGVGTEVRMWFTHPGASGDGSGSRAVRGREHMEAQLRAGNEVHACLAPVEVVHHVLGRMVQSIAAASAFSVTKISDLRAANAAIARYIESAAGDEIHVTIAASPRHLSLTAGPISAQGQPDASTLQPLVDAMSLASESLVIELRDPPRERGL